MKNWKWIVGIVAAAAAVAGVVAVVIVYREQILDLFDSVRETLRTKSAGVKEKLCPRKVAYTEDELADFADV